MPLTRAIHSTRERFEKLWNPVYPRGDVESLFSGDIKPVLSTRIVGAFRIQTAEVTPASDGYPPRPWLMFIHGSPGDWKAWTHYLAAPELRIFSKLIAVDRPGFGGSEAGRVMADLRAQARLFAELIPRGQKALVVGHSLGGALAGWMALNHADKISAALSIAGSLAASLEAPRWYNSVASWRVVQSFMPRSMLLANEEMLGLSIELGRMHLEWSRLRVPFAMMQGGKDRLVDPRTPDVVESMAPKSFVKVIHLPDENHFVLWERPDLVIREILGLLRTNESALKTLVCPC